MARSSAALLRCLGLLGLVLVALLPTGCERAAASGQVPATMAASSTYIEAALREFLGPDIPIMRLAEPGTCPGHFDLRPSQIQALRSARLLLRFDFQKSLDSKLERVAEGGLRIVGIAVPGALCAPDSYLTACRQAGDALVQAGLLDQAKADQTIADVQQRMAGETEWAREQINAAHLREAPVVTSMHQAGFCKFLGLNVLAGFRGADLASVEELDQAARAAGARLIVANAPEGRGLADALAARLDVPVVVFDNFPDEEHHGCRFDGLLHENVRRLVEAASQ